MVDILFLTNNSLDFLGQILSLCQYSFTYNWPVLDYTMQKVNGSVGWQCTWETLNEDLQYFSTAPVALHTMALTKEQYKPLGIHRFVCDMQDSRAYFGQNAMLCLDTEKYRPQEISFDQQM